MYYGAGAGSLPTASAVMSDVVDITKKILKGEKVTKIDQYFTTKKILSIEDISSKYYIRMLSNSGNNTVSKVTSTFEKYDIKTLEIITEQRNDDKYNIVIMTEKTNEKLFRNCIDNLKNIGNSLVIENIIRIEESN